MHAIRRAAHRAEPTYEALRERVRGSPVVTPNETGWKVNAQLQWLWAAVTPDTTVYAIQPGRGFAEAARCMWIEAAQSHFRGSVIVGRDLLEIDTLRSARTSIC